MSIKTSFTAAMQAVKATVLPEKNAATTPAPPAEKKTGPDLAAPTLLLAWRSPGVNRQLLVCYKPDTDPNNPNNLVSVRVRNNINFLPGMRVRAQHVEAGIYNLVGPLPRWRGRY